MNLKELSTSIVFELQKKGYQAVFAGGCVRDMLLGLEPHDYDVATSALPEQVVELFKNEYTIVECGKVFGVIRLIKDKMEIEIATFRSDGFSSDSRRPDSVNFTSMEEDAKRRDFTINGLFLDPITEDLHDYVNGKMDLIHLRKIRFIGNLEDRIKEDNLRLLRLARFSIKLNFIIADESYDAAKKHSGLIQNVSAERIKEELFKAFMLKNVRRYIMLLKELDLLKYILPELIMLEGVKQKTEFHPEGDVFIHSLLVAGALDETGDPILILAGLLHDIGKAAFDQNNGETPGHAQIGSYKCETICDRLKFSNDEKEKLLYLVGEHMKFLDVKKMKMSTFKRFIRNEFFPELLTLHKADCMGSNNDLSDYDFTVVKMKEIPIEEVKPEPLINGYDLIQMGFKEGPDLGQALKQIEELQLEGIIKTKEEALEKAKQIKG